MKQILCVIAVLLVSCGGAVEPSLLEPPTPTMAAAEPATAPAPTQTADPSPTLPAVTAAATLPSPLQVSLDQPFQLTPGETAELAAEVLTITLDEVTNDSRCPQDTECFWAGEATLNGHATADGDVVPFTLIIGGDNLTGETSVAQLGRYQVAVSALDPIPTASSAISPADYTATLIVSLAQASATSEAGYIFAGEANDIAYRFEVTAQPGSADTASPNDQLIIRYTLENRGAVDVILFNKGHSEDAADGSVAYVIPSGGGIIELGQRAHVEPPDKDCPLREAEMVPLVSWLRAGETVTGEMTAELPLQPNHPFDDCTPSPPLPEAGAPLQVCLGYAVANSEIRIDEKGYVEDGDMEALQALIAAQALLCSDPFVLSGEE